MIGGWKLTPWETKNKQSMRGRIEGEVLERERRRKERRKEWKEEGGN